MQVAGLDADAVQSWCFQDDREADAERRHYRIRATLGCLSENYVP